MNKNRLAALHTFAPWLGLFTLALLASLATRFAVGIGTGIQPRSIAQNTPQKTLTFEANNGQFPAAVRFVARSNDYQASLWADAVQFDFGDGAVQMDLSSMGRGAMEEEGTTATHSNYYGAKAIVDVPHFRSVWYRNVFPGADLHLHANGAQLEYDFVLAPNTAPEQIRFRYVGADTIGINSAGDLVVRKGRHALVQQSPRCFVERGRFRTPVPGRFKIRPDGSIGFQLAAYDTGARLVIDPIVSYQTTYLGGEKFDTINDMTVDSDGNVFLTGTTFSSAIDGFASTSAGGHNAYAAKLATNGQSYFTFLGGGGDQTGRALALLPNGGLAVVGETNDSWPALSPPVRGPWDAFVAALDRDGLVTAGHLLGGSGTDYGHGVASDSQGRIYIAGETWSTDFPTTNNAHITSCLQRLICQNGSVTDAGANGFWALFDPASKTVEYATYIGGSKRDKAHAIAVDSLGMVHVAGETDSTDFPLRGALQSSLAGATDGFVATYDPTRSGDASWLTATYFGGSGEDTINRIATSPSGLSVIAGETESADLPLSANAIDRDCGTAPTALCQTTHERDGFLAAINPVSPMSLVYSGYLGGSGNDSAHSVSAPSNTEFWIAGETMSADFPATDNAPDSQCGTDGTCNATHPDGFIAKIRFGASNSASLVFSSFLGGADDDTANAIAVRQRSSGETDAYVAGTTRSANLATNGSHDTLCGTDGSCNLAGHDVAEDGFLTQLLNVTDGKVPAAPVAATQRRSSSGGGLGGELTGLAFFLAWARRAAKKLQQSKQ